MTLRFGQNLAFYASVASKSKAMFLEIVLDQKQRLYYTFRIQEMKFFRKTIQRQENSKYRTICKYFNRVDTFSQQLPLFKNQTCVHVEHGRMFKFFIFHMTYQFDVYDIFPPFFARRKF